MVTGKCILVLALAGYALAMVTPNCEETLERYVLTITYIETVQELTFTC